MRIVKFQAQIVMEQWLIKQSSEDPKELMSRLINYVEKEQGFAEFASGVVFRLFPC